MRVNPVENQERDAESNSQEDSDSDTASSDEEEIDAQNGDQIMEDEETPIRVGLGGGRRAAAAVPFVAGDILEREDEERPPNRSGIGIGFSNGEAQSRGGIGSSSRSTNPPIESADVPSAFGRTQRSFVRNDQPPTAAPVPLSAHERAHFAKLSGTFGARMMQKMGWQVVCYLYSLVFCL